MTTNMIDETDAKQLAASRISDYLSAHGYQIAANTRITGESGVEHTFDLVAKRNDGFTTRTMAVAIITGGNQEAESSAVFNFANKAFDTGINERVLVAIPGLTPETKNLAEKQRIRVFDKEKLETLLATPVPASIDLGKSKLASREDLVARLGELGYTVKERAHLRGKSGIEHTFDIVARDMPQECMVTTAPAFISRVPSI